MGEGARHKNPKVVMRVHVQNETDESGKPKVSVLIAFGGARCRAANPKNGG
jgi:hypothetical protein